MVEKRGWELLEVGKVRWERGTRGREKQEKEGKGRMREWGYRDGGRGKGEGGREGREGQVGRGRGDICDCIRWFLVTS